MGGNHQSKSRRQQQQQKTFSDISKSPSSLPSPPAETHDNDQEVVPQTESNLGTPPPTPAKTEMPESDHLAAPLQAQRVSDVSAEHSEQVR